MDGLEPLGKLNEVTIKVEGDTFLLAGGKIKIHPNKVTFDAKATLEDGVQAGIFVQRQMRANLWNVGDWALAMEERFGEDAAQYVSSEHFAESYLRRARWVCEKVGASRRVKELSFEHHAAVASLESKDQDKWLQRAVSKKLTVQDLRRAMRKQSHKERYVEQELPKGRYRLIYVDPAWEFGDSGSIPGPTGSEAYGKAERHYPTMSVEKIKELPIKEITARECVLALWSPVPLIPSACEVGAEWGFIYKTEYVWHKVGESGLGQNTAGHYSKLEHEVLLIFTRGKMTPDMEVVMQFPSVQTYPRPGGHSAKPEEFRVMLDTIWPSVTKNRNDRIELFARTKAKKWDQWGNEELQELDAKSKAANDTGDVDGNRPSLEEVAASATTH
jgi:N6-adenosine-specific RNA methylase IME4